MAETRKGPVLGLILIVLGLGAFGFRYAMNNNWIPGLQTVASSVPEADRNLREYKSDNSDATVRRASTSNVNVALPSDEPTDKDLPEIRIKFWAWQGHNSIKLAVGGPVTTKDSLTEKYGVKIYLERQDNTNQLRNELFNCAKELSSGRQDCSSGIHMTTLMGDQLQAQLAGWNEQFRQLGEDLIIEKIGIAGRSDGEDAFLASPDVKLDPQNARGIVVAAAPREGDQNIVLFWADQNDIPINVDQRTYDPDAINFMDADDYIKAVTVKFNPKVCEPRAEVKNGVRTGKTVQACVDAVTTWTPGDVLATVAENARGGVVRIFSSHENSSQMPDSILGIKRWNKQHAQVVVNFLAAVTEAGEQIRTSPAALRRSTEIAAKIYGELGNGSEEEKDPRFWLKYYRGATETDAEGNQVQLGGSLAFTLADNLKYWGVNGGTDYYRDSYELFGGYMRKYYPNDVRTLEPYEAIANKTYVRAVARLRQQAAQQQATGVIREFERGEEITSVSASRSWAIEFETGQDTFTPRALRTLEELRRVLSTAQNQLVRVEGHTDNVGNPAFNQDLSERRALAVKTWLQMQSRDAFSDNRFVGPEPNRVVGHGQNQPVADNNTIGGRARNRRVEIVLGS